MVKIATSGRTEWPTSSPQRVRRRRESKVAYYGPNGTKYLQRHIPSISTNSGHPPGYHPSRHNVQIHQQSPREQPSKAEYLNLFEAQDPVVSPSSFSSNFPHHDQVDNSWMPMNSQYTLPTHPPNPSHVVGNGSPTPLNATPGELLYNGEDIHSWQTMTLTTDNVMTDPDVMSESRFGSFDSFNSLALTVNTVASSVSDFGCPASDSSFESPRASNLSDMYLPGMFFFPFFSYVAALCICEFYKRSYRKPFTSSSSVCELRIRKCRRLFSRAAVT